MLLIKACRGARRAPENLNSSTGYRAHAVRPYATNLDQPSFETVSDVRPLLPLFSETQFGLDLHNPYLLCFEATSEEKMSTTIEGMDRVRLTERSFFPGLLGLVIIGGIILSGSLRRDLPITG